MESNIPMHISWDDKKLRNIKKHNKIKEILSRKFWLVVARLEPENNIHIDSGCIFSNERGFPLIIIGDFTSESYRKEVERISDGCNNIIFLGSIYDLEILDMLRQNCFAYIHGHTVGGTNPSLLEAMIMKNIIIAHDNEFNREVCGESALYFEEYKDLIDKICMVEDKPINYIKFKDYAFKRAKEQYLWDKIEKDYVDLLVELAKRSSK